MSKFILITIISVMGSISFAQGTPPVSNNKTVESQILAAIAVLEANSKKTAELERKMSIIDDPISSRAIISWDIDEIKLEAILMARQVREALHTISNGLYSRSGITFELAARFDPRIETYIMGRLLEIDSAIYHSQELIKRMLDRAGIESHAAHYKKTIDLLIARRAMKKFTPKLPEHYQQIHDISVEIRNLATRYLGLDTASSLVVANKCGDLF